MVELSRGFLSKFLLHDGILRFGRIAVFVSRCNVRHVVGSGGKRPRELARCGGRKCELM